MKKAICLLFVLCLILCVTAPVSARDFVDPERFGSVTFHMEWEDEPLDGGSLTLYRVAEVARTGNSEYYALIPEFSGSGISLENLSDSALASRLEKLVLETGLSGVTAPISEGKAVFAELLPGVYVVSQSDAQATQGYAAISPFLISLPQLVEDQYVYDLTAQPKVPLETKPTESTEPTETEPTKPTEPDLPQTGQLNWPVPILTVCGFALFAIGCYLRFGKRENHA